ncbi:hypothetical protein [Longimicrobium sp.]|uniref:hypothetical protein n=1 Tax=Longimicrobium sp. TaxID=2029185 RepID=UPI002E2FA1BF|nr:hypothetical protein [Longimicrobium sp.]HEX6039455.1 hypothetical protein [Longimicrobium sp.]
MRRICATLLPVLVLMPVRARAQEGEGTLPELVQELFTAETAYPQEAGAVQLTADARIEDGATARLLAEVGITDRFQLSVLSPYADLEDGGAEEEVTVGAQYNLFNGPTMAASLSLEATIPTEGDGVAEWEPALIVARQLGMAQLHGSVSAGISKDQTDFTPALGLMLDAGRITPTLELAATVADGETPEISLTPGLFVHLLPNLEAGVGAPLDVSHSTLPNVVAMVTLEF